MVTGHSPGYLPRMTSLVTKTCGSILALLLASCEMAEPIMAEVPSADPAPEASLATASVVPAPEPEATSALREDTELSCTYPVGKDDTGETLRARYGDAVQVAELAGPEGETLPGVVLWPDNRERRIEVAFTSERLDRVIFVRANAPSLWSVLGLRNHDSIARAQAINGVPFEFSGFGWDAGGNVSDFRGGQFAQFEPCRVLMVLAYDYPVSQPPRSLVGDVPIMSDRDDIDEHLVFVDEIGLAFDPVF